MAGSDSYVQLPADSTGKKARTFQNVVGANTVEEEGIVLCDRNGKVVGVRQYGPLRVSNEDRTLFYDPHDGGTIDTERWVTPTGTNAPTQSGSLMTFGTTTTTSIYGKLTSQASFFPIIPGFLQVSFALKLDAAGAAKTNGHRYWGTGTSIATPTTANPVTDGVGFEIDTDGKMYAVVFNGGSQISAINLSSTGTGDAASTQPLDGLFHRYVVQIRTDTIYWFIDSLDTPVATATWQVPATQSQPILLQTVNPAASVAGGGYGLVVQGTVVADTAGNSTQLSDGTYPWRKAKIDSSGRLSALTESPETVATGTITAAQPVATTPVTGGTVTATVPDGAASWHIYFTGTPNNATAFQFEGSMDSGTSWVGLPGLSRTTTTQLTAMTLTGATTNLGVNTWSGDATGMTQIRVRCTSFTTTGPDVRIVLDPRSNLISAVNNVQVQGGAGGGSAPQGAPVYVGGYDGTNIRQHDLRLKGTQGTYGLTTQDLKDSGRTHVNYFATAAASGATTVETAITLTKSSGTSATSAATSFVITSGKTFRITSLTFATRGHATATIQETSFKLRLNTAGAVTTSSTPILIQARCATPATASAWDRFQVALPDGFEIAGNGTIQFGVTAAATFTTNAPTWDVALTGYEY